MSHDQGPVGEKTRPDQAVSFSHCFDKANEAGQELTLYAMGAGPDEDVFSRAESIGKLARQLSDALNGMDDAHLLSVAPPEPIHPATPDHRLTATTVTFTCDARAISDWAEVNGCPEGERTLVWALERLKTSRPANAPEGMTFAYVNSDVLQGLHDFAGSLGAAGGTDVFRFALDRLKAGYNVPPGKQLVNFDAVPMKSSAMEGVRALADFAINNGLPPGVTVYQWALERLKAMASWPTEPGKAWVQVSEADAETLRAGGVVLPKPEPGMVYTATNPEHGKAWEKLCEIVWKRSDCSRASVVMETLVRLAKEPPIDAEFGNKMGALRKQAENYRIKGTDEDGTAWITRLASVLSWLDTEEVNEAANKSRRNLPDLWPATAGKAGA